MHEGIVGPLIGFDGDGVLPGPAVPRPPALLVLRLRDVRRGLPRRRDLRVAADPTRRRHDRRQHPVHGRRRAPSLPRAGAAVVPAEARARGGPSSGSSDRRRAARPARGQRPRRPQRRVLLRHPAAHHHRELRHLDRRRARHPRRGHLRRHRDRRVPPHRPTAHRGAPRRAARRPDQRARRGRDHRRRRHHEAGSPTTEIIVFAFLLLAAGIGHHLEADGHHDARAAAAPGVARRGPRRCRRCCGRWSRSRCGGRRPTRCSAASSPATPSSAGVDVPRRAR